MAIQAPETKLKKKEDEGVLQGTEGEGVVKLTGGAQSLEGTTGGEDVSTDIGMGQPCRPLQNQGCQRGVCRPVARGPGDSPVCRARGGARRYLSYRD